MTTKTTTQFKKIRILRIFTAMMVIWFGVCAPVRAGQADIALAPLWSATDLKNPASVLVIGSGREGFLLVTQIDGDPNAKDGKGSIAKLSLDGTTIARTWLTGLHAPKGMATLAGKLLVADIDEIAVIDLATATIESRMAVPGAQALHDIAVTDSGTLYVSDPAAGKVHRILGDRPSLLLDGLPGARGLATVAETLLLAADDRIWQIDAAGKKHALAKDFAEPATGLLRVGRDQFIASSSAGAIYFVEGLFADEVEESNQNPVEGFASANADGVNDHRAEGSYPNGAEGSYPNRAEGSYENRAEGSYENRAEGSYPNRAEGSNPNSAEGSFKNQAEGSAKSPANNRARLLLDTRGENYAGDIAWHASEHTLYVPTLASGTVDAYALKVQPVADPTGGR